ncbi:DUF5994 family protein [Parasphingorhabdus pacifica]
MKSTDAVRGQVDGGWWPWSRDPEVEFPELVMALRPRIGWANRVSYHLDMWAAVPRKMFIEGRTVHFEGFRSMDPHTVAVTSSIAGRLSLLVVPLDASEEAARAAMTAAVSNDFARGGGEMARNTMPLGVPSFGFELVVSPRSADPVSEERWETEGGQVRVPA